MTTASTAPPAWPHCGEGADADDQVGCRGIRIAPGGKCLNHLPQADRDAYIGSITTGSSLDLRGTTIDTTVLDRILAASTDPATGRPHLGDADFRSATFTGDAGFRSATFAGDAGFESATFTGRAGFESATFNGHAGFRSATFTTYADFQSATFNGHAGFRSATFATYALFQSATFNGDAGFHSATITHAVFRWAAFNGDAVFRSATFNGDAGFHSATFTNRASFESATFTTYADFESATFNDHAVFRSATFHDVFRFASAFVAGDLHFAGVTFEGLQHIGPFVCAGRVSFDRARLTGSQVTIEAAAWAVRFERTTFEGSAALRLRYANVQLSQAALAAPIAVQAWPVPYTRPDGTELDESPLHAHPPDVHLLSLEGVDAAHVVLTDVDLGRCQFTGAFHLDQIQIGFGCRFAEPPAGWHRRGTFPARWSRRKVLAEEQHWRAQAGGRAGQGWVAGPHHRVPGRGAGPDDLVGVYQQLRKAFEEARNEPDAADFYYGEMEARRHDPQRPWGERRLLWVYWLASGYGLRASRALGWLLAAMGVTLLLMVLFGLPNETPDPRTTGTWTAGTVNVTTRAPDPVLTLSWRKRLTAARTEKATVVVVNSVVFRSSGQNLTLPGTAIEMASRIGEPMLLGLAALAVRSRVKR
ncbi:pentapeptide repeat-containing protein [Kitasatospora sp. NPDC002965]|uniref:pentapeptide repeat-containing protein n=1 Tax=Kitasatospora sp. NPDC002965 TaxID=3154775 RepID=UPI0033B15AEC